MMKVLNIVRSTPDDFVKKFIETFSEDKGNKVIALFEGDVDWSSLIDEIFSHDRVICWW
jgi:hypothetical protein